jgi:hypothetical protein
VGKHSIRSLYAIVNNRGIKQIYTPVMWKLSVPPRVHIFLWLFPSNKTLTRDNLAKRKNLDDKTCLFCNELESVNHLFFECYIAQSFWKCIYEIINVIMGNDFISVTKYWINDSKLKCLNAISATTLWALCKFRNDMCFNNVQWMGMSQISGICVRMLRDWCWIQKTPCRSVTTLSPAPLLEQSDVVRC